MVIFFLFASTVHAQTSYYVRAGATGNGTIGHSSAEVNDMEIYNNTFVTHAKQGIDIAEGTGNLAYIMCYSTI